MTQLLIISFFLFLCGCTINCKSNTEFKRQFFGVINTLKATIEDDKDTNYIVTNEDVLYSVLYLEAVTNVKGSPLSSDDTPFFYGNSKDVKKDISKWKRWYEENKCIMTIDKADSLYRIRLRKELLDYHPTVRRRCAKQSW